MSIQMPLIAVRPPSHRLHTEDRDGASAPRRVSDAPAVHSPAAPAASRPVALLALVVIGILHLAILVAAFEATPFLTLTFVGAVVAFVAGLVVCRVEDDGASVLIERRHGEPALEHRAARTFVATTCDAADVSEWGSAAAEQCPPVADPQLMQEGRTVADGRLLRARLLRILAVDTYVLLVAPSEVGDFDDGATTVRVRLAGYRRRAPGSVEGVEALEAIESLLASGSLTVELQGHGADGIRIGSMWAGITPIAPALTVTRHARAIAAV